jgi:sigma-B regulation protein RsbU (phosphoserine phosphatase)
MAIALDYAQLIAHAAEQAALRRELQIAQEVQAQLFPHERPAMRTIRYAGICRAARGVGGDFYDYLPLTGGRLGIAVADISGKGLPAALRMASLQALLRSHAPTYARALGDLGHELNRHLCESGDGARFATLFFGVYEDDSRRLVYLNAGHLPPIVLAPASHGCDASVRRLAPGGMVLGLFGDQSYQPGCTTLAQGERLLVFSDGVTEATDTAGDMFGEDRLMAVMAGGAALDIDGLAARIIDEVDRFVGAAPQQDDITVIAAEVVA